MSMKITKKQREKLIFKKYIMLNSHGSTDTDTKQCKF